MNAGDFDIEGLGHNWSSLSGYSPITEPIVKEKKVGRNEPCPCGSGKKYKKCCI